jgi:hypothetical protein
VTPATASLLLPQRQPLPAQQPSPLKLITEDQLLPILLLMGLAYLLTLAIMLPSIAAAIYLSLPQFWRFLWSEHC